MSQPKIDEQRKQQIRAAATRCFVRRGYAPTRLLDIAREAGLSKGGVYFHYKAKELLFQDILVGQLTNLQTRWAEKPPADLPADRALVQAVTVHLQSFTDHPEEARLCNLVVTMALHNTDFRDRLDAIFAAARAHYAEIVQRGVSEGVLSGDPQLIARGIIALIYGLAAQSSVDPQGRLPVTTEQAVELITRLARR